MYPLKVDTDAVVGERQLAKYKLAVKEFESYLGVENALSIKICEAVDFNWLEGICHKTMGFSHLTPMH